MKLILRSLLLSIAAAAIAAPAIAQEYTIGAELAQTATYAWVGMANSASTNVARSRADS